MKVKLAGFFLVVMALVICGAAAQATLITFDDIVTSDWVLINNPYNGLNWSNFGVVNKNNYLGSGYDYGTISPPNTAYNGGGMQASMTADGAPTFDLNSAYFTSAWQNNNVLTVEGFLGGVSQGISISKLNTTTPQLITFNFLGIDTAVFASSNAHFAMDNLTVNDRAVPEPATLLGFGIPMLMVGLGKLRGLRK